MKRFITSLCILIGMQITMSAAKADWHLYFWSDIYGLNGDAGQFATTDDADIFVLKSVNVPAQGFNVGVHSSNWSALYGWSDEGGSISQTGVAVLLAPSNAASAWLDLPAGKYDVTFDASAPSLRFDPASGTPDPEHVPATYLMGGDLSMATYVEDLGAVFRYADGTPGDLFDILESYGVNLVRLRLYNQPGTPVKDGSNTYRTPLITTKYRSGNGTLYAGPDDILNLARRAKNHHMQICLSFHLSDYWSNAGMQMIPSAWAGATTHQLLCDSVYNFVYEYMLRMVAQGTAPEFVSVGNETNMGMLFQTTNGTAVSYGGKWDNTAQMVNLYNSAYDAVKAASPASQVIIHHSYGHDGKIRECRNFFITMQNNGGKFDIVGGSYYPYWASLQNSTDNTPTGMLRWAADMQQNIGKPVMVMEVGYSWTQYRPAGRNGGNYEGQLSLNGSYNEATEAGQESFMRELHEAMAQDDNILGYLYWDPVFVDQQVDGSWIKTCWAEKYSGSNWWEDGNVVSNTTWFDYSGNPLSALYREINSRKPAAIPTAEPSSPVTDYASSDDARCRKQFIDGELIFRQGERTYNAQGMQLR